MPSPLVSYLPGQQQCRGSSNYGFAHWSVLLSLSVFMCRRLSLNILCGLCGPLPVEAITHYCCSAQIAPAGTTTATATAVSLIVATCVPYCW